MHHRFWLTLGLCILLAPAFANTTTSTNPSDVTIPDTMQADPTLQKNKQEGQQFLNSNKIKPGVVTLADGLQYKVLQKGTGQKPTANDTVVVDYVGTFIDGTEFDSSIKNGAPATFPVNGVIPGWTEILQLMPKGSTWEVYIPSDLAYGDAGAPPAIEPGKTLLFKITLQDIQK